MADLSDRELLELAAKAAGIALWPGDAWRESVMGSGLLLANGRWIWNPLNHDGDALRLAVKLGIQLHFEGTGEDEAVWADDVMLWTDGAKESATRKAIVMAAAKRAQQQAQGGKQHG